MGSEGLKVVVVDGEGPSLMGRDWIKELNLEWQEVKRIDSQLDSQLDGIDEGEGGESNQRLRREFSQWLCSNRI
ncbi:MAG: hypothetical protein V2I33_16735 [Kangiellaceae bacterium]|nr:hypothetical protein [Kangiellaceae bacterium]